jgi:hypothetical protein
MRLADGCHLDGHAEPLVTAQPLPPCRWTSSTSRRPPGRTAIMYRGVATK